MGIFGGLFSRLFGRKSASAAPAAKGTAKAQPRQVQGRSPAPATAKPAGAQRTPSAARPQPGAVQRTARPATSGQDSRSALVPVAANRQVQPALHGHVQAVGELAGDDVLARIVEYDGIVHTAAGGRVKTGDKQRAVVAVLDNGFLVIARYQASSIEVAEVREMTARAKIPVSHVYLVESEVLRHIYENAERRAGDGRRSTDPSKAQRQREFMELVDAAARVNASDIHIKIQRHEATVMVRVQGVMRRMRDLKGDAAQEMLQAAFAMADQSDATYQLYEYQGARISEKTSKGGFSLPPGVQAIRLQFNPTGTGGRYMVARLLYSQVKYGRDEDVDTLGYEGRQLVGIRELRRMPTGINIISGPTGSGKSTTLQRSLMSLMREKRFEVNVVTIEDPPEYVIPGAAQLPVTNVKSEEERSEAFRKAITASLRSDPDIIMIGEIRDAPSAKLAFQAAMTGHQVWCSLHANDAVACLDRLRDMETEIYKLTDPALITGLIGQRLVRKINPKRRVGLEEARRRELISEATFRSAARIAELTGIDIYSADVVAPGEVEQDGDEPYIGRTVVAEVVRPNSEFMSLFREDKNKAIAYWIEKMEGMTMLEHGIVKMLRGEAEPKEIEDKVGVFDEVPEERLKYLLDTFVRGAKELDDGGV